MKTLRLVLFIAFLVGAAAGSDAQVSFNVHIGTPPQWAPGNCSDARYYYLPDIEAYYDVPSSMFIYFNGGRWVHRHHLPARYRDYDLYRGHKIVMSDYRGDRPYSYFREHRKRYSREYRDYEGRHVGERPEYHDRREMDRYERHSHGNERAEQRYEYRNNDDHRGNGNNGNGRGNGKHDKQDKHDRR